MEIGERIRWLRKQQNMTISELGKRVGVTRQTISRYETGAIDEIPMDKLETIASCLSVDSTYLLGFSIESQIDSLQLDIQQNKIALAHTTNEDEKVEIAHAIATLSESLDDLRLVKSLTESAALDKAQQSKGKNAHSFTIGSKCMEWKSDKKGIITMRIDSWLFWTLKGFAADKRCSLEDTIESILYDRIQEEIENSDEFQHGGE